MKLKILFSFLVIILSQALSQNLERIEPPFWWAGFKGDELYENHKIESFKQVVNKISNLSTDEVKKLWIENKDKIQSNVNIISDLMNYRITNQDKGIQGEGWPKRLF